MEKFIQIISNYFIDESDNLEKLNLFGWEHITVSLMTILIAVLLFIYRDNIKKWHFKNKIRFIMAAVLFTNMAVHYTVFIVKGIYDWRIHLPLHLCHITGYLFMYILVTNNKKFYKLIYFFTFVGPLPAMIWPNTPIQFNRNITYVFIISHHVLLLTSLYCLFVLDYKICKKDMLKAFVFGNGVFAAVFIFNKIFDTNYIMTDKLPEHITAMFPFLEVINYPIIWLEICALLMIAIAYIPVILLNKSDKKKLALSDIRNIESIEVKGV